MTVKLLGYTPFLEKDQAKSDRATKFIGRGSLRSSTQDYARSWGALANCGQYASEDAVFISAEGLRSGRMLPNFAEIQRAADAGVAFITDDLKNRSRPHNLGEREVAAYLTKIGYAETGKGYWTRAAVSAHIEKGNYNE